MFHVSNRDDGGHIALDSLGTFHHGIIGDIGSVPGVLPRAVLGVVLRVILGCYYV